MTSTYIKNKPNEISKLQMNSVILHACSNGIYLQKLLRNLMVNLRNLFLVELVFKERAMNLSGMESTFCDHKILKFCGMGGEGLKNQ